MICEIETRIQWRKNFSNRTNRKKVIAFFVLNKPPVQALKSVPDAVFATSRRDVAKKIGNW